jgi:acyl carrier protein
MQIEDNQEVRREVRDYLVSSFYVAEPEALADSGSLLKNGIIDETGMLEMVAFLESTFGVKIADEEIVPENLDSIARVAAFVGRKKAAADAAAEAELGEPVEEPGDEPVDEVGMGHGSHVADAVELDQVHPG